LFHKKIFHIKVMIVLRVRARVSSCDDTPGKNCKHAAMASLRKKLHLTLFFTSIAIILGVTIVRIIHSFSSVGDVHSYIHHESSDIQLNLSSTVVAPLLLHQKTINISHQHRHTRIIQDKTVGAILPSNWLVAYAGVGSSVDLDLLALTLHMFGNSRVYEHTLIILDGNGATSTFSEIETMKARALLVFPRENTATFVTDYDVLHLITQKDILKLPSSQAGPGYAKQLVVKMLLDKACQTIADKYKIAPPDIISIIDADS